MPEILLSNLFEGWLDALKDVQARIKIVARLRSMSAAISATPKRWEMVFWRCASTSAQGYRLYYTRRGADVYLLHVGGDKASQKADIGEAKQMADEIRKGGT